MTMCMFIGELADCDIDLGLHWGVKCWSGAKSDVFGECLLWFWCVVFICVGVCCPNNTQGAMYGLCMCLGYLNFNGIDTSKTWV